MVDESISIWQSAAATDPTLKVRRKGIPLLQAKRVGSIGYSRHQLFSRMMKGQVSIFYDYPVTIKNRLANDRRKYLSKNIKKGFPTALTVRIQAGPSRHRHRVRVPELMRRWEAGRAVVSVTDLHFRGTKFYRLIDTSALSDFNILCGIPELVDGLEMMTLVVSSAGNLTDTHADDCDGSNHCFLGKKLWLAWDRIEGKAKGFQDADRDYVFDQAAFDMDTFISLPSSKWFVVKANQTLFLPGSLAHKVITLEPYIGVGSFHVALPGYVNSLKRWILYDAPDASPNLTTINHEVIRRIRKLRRASHDLQEHWGLFHMERAVELWNKNECKEHKQALLDNPIFSAFLEVVARN